MVFKLAFDIHVPKESENRDTMVFLVFFVLFIEPYHIAQVVNFRTQTYYQFMYRVTQRKVTQGNMLQKEK